MAMSDSPRYETEGASGDGSNDRPETYNVKHLRRWLPSTLSDEYRRIAVCAIRNPDASQRAISERVGVSETSVANMLSHLVYDLDVGSGRSADWIQARGDEARYAETFDELTEKQRALVDWLARHPDSWDAERRKFTSTGTAIAAAVSHDDRYDVGLHPTYPSNFRSAYSHRWVELVTTRRDNLAARGELDDEELPDDVQERLKRKTVREWLDMAGLGHILPDANLDEMPSATPTHPTDDSDDSTTDGPDYKTGHALKTDDGYLCRHCESAGPYESPQSVVSHLRFCDEYETTTDDANADSDDTDASDSDDSTNPEGGAQSDESDERESDDEQPPENVFADPDAIRDALSGVKDELDDLRDGLDAVRETAVMPDEVPEGVDEDRLDRIEVAIQRLDERLSDTRVPHTHEFDHAVKLLNELDDDDWDLTEYSVDWAYGGDRVTIEVEAKEERR